MYTEEKKHRDEDEIEEAKVKDNRGVGGTKKLLPKKIGADKKRAGGN